MSVTITCGNLNKDSKFKGVREHISVTGHDKDMLGKDISSNDNMCKCHDLTSGIVKVHVVLRNNVGKAVDIKKNPGC